MLAHLKKILCCSVCQRDDISDLVEDDFETRQLLLMTCVWELFSWWPAKEIYPIPFNVSVSSDLRPLRGVDRLISEVVFFTRSRLIMAIPASTLWNCGIHNQFQEHLKPGQLRFFSSNSNVQAKIHFPGQEASFYSATKIDKKNSSTGR